MYIYILHDNMGNLNGVYTELLHCYLRMIKVWVELYSISDDDYYENYHCDDKVDKDWILYKVPVGEFEDVFIQSKDVNNEYCIELPETYANLRCEIRELKINELT